MWWTVNRKWSIIFLKHFSKHKRCVARNVLLGNILFCLVLNIILVTKQVNANHINMQKKSIHPGIHPAHPQHVLQVR